jgi:hypothetical protein
MWFNLTPGRKHMCAACGQFFVMVQEKDADGGHGHH